MSRVLIYVITLDSMFPNSFSLSCGSALTPVPTSLPSGKKSISPILVYVNFQGDRCS